MDADSAARLVELMLTSFFTCFGTSLLLSVVSTVGNHD